MRKQRRRSVVRLLISAFAFATQIVQFLYFLNPKFQASSHLLWLNSADCVGPGRKPRRPVFSQRGSYFRNIPNRGFNKFQLDDASVTMKEILQKVLKRRKIRIRPGKMDLLLTIPRGYFCCGSLCIAAGVNFTGINLYI